jgi:hypothetical protein
MIDFRKDKATSLTFARVLLFVSAIHVAFRLTSPSLYLVNDDIGILAFLDGSFTGSPEPNTIFNSPIFATMVSFLSYLGTRFFYC